MRKTFVLDLDGTLLQSDGLLHPAVCRCLIELQQKGYKVVVATGRKYIEAERIIEALKLKEYQNAAILSDGQYLIDYHDNTESVAPFLSYPNDYIRIINKFEKVDAVKLMTVDQDYDVFPSVLRAALWKHLFLNAIKLRHPFQGLLIGTKKVIKNIEKITVKPFKCNETLNNDVYKQYQVAFVNDKARFEFKAKAVNKSEMLKKYLHKRNIAHEDGFVFGNDENDVCLFDDFSNSFVVDTAKENVKAKAREIIQHCEGLGVAAKIDELVRSV